jgi:hypothetical protein
MSIAMVIMYVLHRNERDALNQNIDDLNSRNALLHKKYKEQKSLNLGLMRAKRTLEGQNAVMKNKVKKVEEEKDAILAEKEALEAKLKERNFASGEKIKALKEEKAKLESDLAAAIKKYDLAVAKHQKEKNRMKDEITDLQQDLRMTRHKLGRCEKNNARLCIIGNELLERYENKGVFGSISEKEPFTQLKKVELEKFIQEYKDKIEEQELIIEEQN